MARISLKVNGKSRVVETDPSTPLLYILRGELALQGPKFGCGLSQCGACTVIMEGKSIRSCSLPVSAAQNREITTLEGLGSVANPHPIQQAFIDEQAAQCGYCMNGMVMNTKVLLDKNPHPTDTDIKQALSGNLCRCGSYLRIIRAIQRAANADAPPPIVYR
jgi:nicotinate dehydrogenase subunit A